MAVNERMYPLWLSVLSSDLLRTALVISVCLTGWNGFAEFGKLVRIVQDAAVQGHVKSGATTWRHLITFPFRHATFS